MTTERIGAVSLSASLVGAWIAFNFIIPHYSAKLHLMGLTDDEIVNMVVDRK